MTQTEKKGAIRKGDREMIIHPDSPESKLIFGYYKTAYSSEDEKYISIVKAWVKDGKIIVAGRFTDDTHVYWFDRAGLSDFCL